MMIYGMRTGYLCRLEWEKEVMLPPTYLPQGLMERNHIHHVKKCHRRLDPWENIKQITTAKGSINVIVQASKKLCILHFMGINQTIIQKNVFPPPPTPLTKDGSVRDGGRMKQGRVNHGLIVAIYSINHYDFCFTIGT